MLTGVEISLNLFQNYRTLRVQRGKGDFSQKSYTSHTITKVLFKPYFLILEWKRPQIMKNTVVPDENI